MPRRLQTESGLSQRSKAVANAEHSEFKNGNRVGPCCGEHSTNLSSMLKEMQTALLCPFAKGGYCNGIREIEVMSVIPTFKERTA